MSSDDISPLLVKLKSPGKEYTLTPRCPGSNPRVTDLDVKVDALTKLQNAFSVDPEVRGSPPYALQPAPYDTSLASRC